MPIHPMPRHASSRPGCSYRGPRATILGLVGLACLATGSARADPAYKIQPVIKIGDPVGDLTFKATADLRIGALNDAGRLVYNANLVTGPVVQYAEGRHLPIAIPNGDAPGGKWASGLNSSHVIEMDERGNVFFPSTLRIEGQPASLGVFRWDAETNQVTSIAVPRMPADAGLTFETPDGASFSIPAANNRDEVVLRTRVKDAAGTAKPGIFYRDSTGRFTLVLLDGQGISGGGTAITGGSLDLNDAGVVAFVARRQGMDPAGRVSAFLWEQGVLTPLATIGQALAGGHTIAQTLAIRVNDKDRSALVVLSVATAPTQAVLYRFAEGKLQPVAVSGQEMPGGGKLQSVVVGSANTGPTSHWYLSRANSAGQVAFLARLEDGSRAIYRVDATTGQLALLLKEGATTEMGVVTRIQELCGVGYNSKGQLAAVLKFGDGPNTLVLMTPHTP